ncbi:MAG: 1-acyl-sn-glycerol-3-phosphate acyltransferase [Firmicutes bacterium]|nr:1-acyl-sn-glycerol-3-phosphate acyltransferase [Bacillota bacterium]
MLYDVGKFFLNLFYKGCCRIKFIDDQKVPPTGGQIIASNHVSYYDPFAVGLGVKRKIHYMAKKELFEESALVANFITMMGAFPVDRGKADRKAIQKALNLLKSGEAVGIFPEGTRSEDGEVGEGQHGMAMFSVMAGVPIVPAAVIGTQNVRIKGGIIPRFRQIFVKYGDPVYPDQFDGTKKEKLQKITIAVLDSIRNLKKELETEWEP